MRVASLVTPVLIALLFAACAQVPPSPPSALDPRGLFFHAWSGSSAGTEWALVHRAADGAFRLTDVFGNGFRFRVTPDGVLTVHDEGQGGSGGGRFLDADEARFDWRNWGMAFSSRIWRAPHSDVDFPILSAPPVDADARLAGEWDARLERVSPTTGATLGVEHGRVRVSVDGPRLRFDWPDGGFDQGLCFAADAAQFRVLASASSGPYATPAGCATSRAEDVLGRAALRDGVLVVDLYLQTRAKVGAQIQSQFRAELRRAAR